MHLGDGEARFGLLLAPRRVLALALSLKFFHALDELFSEFDETPLAAASIGQVYKAALPDGTAVAVKVQRPGVCNATECLLVDRADAARLVPPVLTALAERGCELRGDEAQAEWCEDLVVEPVRVAVRVDDGAEVRQEDILDA